MFGTRVTRLGMGGILLIRYHSAIFHFSRTSRYQTRGVLGGQREQNEVKIISLYSYVDTSLQDQRLVYNPLFRC